MGYCSTEDVRIAVGENDFLGIYSGGVGERSAEKTQHHGWLSKLGYHMWLLLHNLAQAHNICGC